MVRSVLVPVRQDAPDKVASAHFTPGASPKFFHLPGWGVERSHVLRSLSLEFPGSRMSDPKLSAEVGPAPVREAPKGCELRSTRDLMLPSTQDCGG